MNTRRLILAVLVSLAPFVVGVLLAPSAAFAEESCPNEALRTGFNALLPECRAYELVSPPGTPPQLYLNPKALDKNDMYRGEELPGAAEGVHVSVSGERIAFRSDYAPSSSTSDSQYFMATRGPRGWSTVSLTPPQSPEYGIVCQNAFATAYSPELTSWVLGDGWGQPGSGYSGFAHGGESCGKDDPELVQGEPRDFQNLFVSKGLTAPYQLIDVTPEKVQPAHAWFQGASSNLEHVVFDEVAKLTPEAPEADDFYIWSAGAVPAVRLVTVLPNGKATEGAMVNRVPDEGNGESEGLTNGDEFVYKAPEAFTHAVSSDASRVFFHANGNLYARENAYAQQSALEGERCTEPEKACTVQLDASQTGGEGGGGRFMWASADGSRAFFTDTARLTASSTAESEKPDLYEYDFEAPEGKRLTDLTADAAEPANVQGVSGVAEDGSDVYFVADGKLTSEANSNGDSAVAGQPNLYVAHGGEVDFIATLDPTYDNMDWDPKTITTRVSENGRYIGFDSQRELTGYDNTPLEPSDCIVGEPRPCTEIFLYDTQQKHLSCVSCDPSGTPPTAPAAIGEPMETQGDFNVLGERYFPAYLQRNVTDQGQVFFHTAQPLVPRVSNGLENAYEYRNGEVQLLSTGTGNVSAYFYEASPSGNDVFIATSQPLTPGAEGSEYSVYDVRVDGGFTPPEPATACSEEDCRGAITPTPLLGAPSSQTLVASGNPVVVPTALAKPKPKAKPVKCKKGDVKKRNRCVKKAKSKKKAKKSAKTNRGASR
jgi:hypothetical protein